MNNLIEIQDLLMQRNGRDVLRVDSLHVKRGETLAVVGPNGAGKSTLLLALARLLRPVRGGIQFEGKPIQQLDDLTYRRRISFVFQDPLLMDMSVADNIALGLKFRGTQKAEIASKVKLWAKAMGVESLIERRASQLSGGEAQRVSLARAFVLDPQLLLMDEPFSAVDPPTRSQLIEDLSQLLSNEHRTTIFVTHNLKEAAQIGDRLAVIMDGSLLQAGTPHELKSSPCHPQIEKFLKEL